MKRRTKEVICEGLLLLSAVGLFVTVGAVENFSIGLATGGILLVVCAAFATVAVIFGYHDE